MVYRLSGAPPYLNVEELEHVLEVPHICHDLVYVFHHHMKKCFPPPSVLALRGRENGLGGYVTRVVAGAT